MNTSPSLRISLVPHPTRVLSLVLVLLVGLSTPLLAQSVITTLAGGVNPFNGAPAISISFGAMSSVISDGVGGFYFAAGSPQHSIYRVAVNGTMTLVAGSGTAGFAGDGGPALSAQLYYPNGIALDGGGNLFIADTYNHRIRKVTPLGVISTIAGNGASGFSGDNGAATSAQLNYPIGVAVDASGNVLIADTSNRRIRRVTAAGVIETFAGNGVSGFSGDNGPATSAQLSAPYGLAFDSGGNLFVADRYNYRIRKINPAGVISTFAGSGTYGFLGDGGQAASARLASPAGIAFDGSGNLLIADTDNSRIRKVVSSGVISTVAGSNLIGFAGDGGQATLAQLNSPYGVALDAAGDLLIADTNNQRIRKVLSSGVISTVAGNGTRGFSGDGGPAVTALFDTPRGVAVDAAGNVLVADTSNSRIRTITPGGVVSTIAGTGQAGFSGDGGPATLARLNLPGSLAPATDGSVYFTDCNGRVRKFSPGGVINTFAMAQWIFCTFDYYYYYEEISRGSIALDTAGNLYVADTYRYRIYKVTPSGVISVYAGNGTFGFGGDGGPATSASISEPWGIAVDASGNLYIADSYNNRIRKVTPAGIISTIAGSEPGGFGGDGGPALSAQFNQPSGLAFDAGGNLYIADTYNHRIRRMTPAGIVTTVAGNGTAGVNGDGGPPTLAQLDTPGGVAVDAAGNLYVADSNNNRIRKVTFTIAAPTLAAVSLNFGAQGGTSKVTLSGTSLITPLTIDAGSGITVSNIVVLSETEATATFTIAPNAAAGARNVTVTTSFGTSGTAMFNVVAPFPDLSIASSQTGNLEIGFDGTYGLVISNVGLAATANPITVTDNLPAGLIFVSGTGIGWTCSASGQTVTCANPMSLSAGASTTLTMTVTVQAVSGLQVTHTAAVAVDADPVSSNNAVSDSRSVVRPNVSFSFSPAALTSGIQASVGLSMAPPLFTHDITGTLTLGFSSSSVIAADDPAIQFASGGRTVNFTIPANTSQARFSSNPPFGSISFQTGTVAGTLSFNVTLKTGVAQVLSSTTRFLQNRPPTVQTVQREAGTSNSLNIAATLTANSREVTQLVLVFSTNPVPTLDCGGLAGCLASGSTLTLDVKSLFESWFKENTQSGGISILHVPLTIQGTIRGSIGVSVRNSLGTSSAVSFTVP